MATPDQFKIAYQNVVAKLNKVFYRVDHCKTAAAQFRVLQQIFHRAGNEQYAAFCCLAVGRCEEAMQNTLAAAAEYSVVGRTFVRLELENHRCVLPNFRENILEATQCYLMAIDCYHERRMFGVCCALLLELGCALVEMREYESGCMFLTRAAKLQQEQSLTLACHTHNMVLRAQLEQGLLAEAATTSRLICQLCNTALVPIETPQWQGEANFTLACLLLLTLETQNAAVQNAYNIDDVHSIIDTYLSPLSDPRTQANSFGADSNKIPQQFQHDVAAPSSWMGSGMRSRVSGFFPVFRPIQQSRNVQVVVPSEFGGPADASALLLDTEPLTLDMQTDLNSGVVDFEFFGLAEAFLVACLDGNVAAAVEAHNELSMHLNSPTLFHVAKLLIDRMTTL